MNKGRQSYPFFQLHGKPKNEMICVARQERRAMEMADGLRDERGGVGRRGGEQRLRAAAAVQADK